MQHDSDEDERSLAELCATPRMPYKLKKAGKRVIGDFLDRWKREGASETAKAQDSQRCPNSSTRYDVNNYSGGPTTIHDVGVIEKRKVR
jgi:hypothetical protein